MMKRPSAVPSTRPLWNPDTTRIRRPSRHPARRKLPAPRARPARATRRHGPYARHYRHARPLTDKPTVSASEAELSLQPTADPMLKVNHCTVLWNYDKHWYDDCSRTSRTAHATWDIARRVKTAARSSTAGRTCRAPSKSRRSTSA
ncbi:hypothetical protein B0H17DRAFT_1073071 [Mycena rosella]|uniref:Uncharacterized protein n=1 Tax=Mycena rosella TaxID=1033263 RepID=A0AAD7GAV3_MYCRO|nr:hypothetical protein B0H17DRAFT_1073071 [Mycena rosella]